MIVLFTIVLLAAMNKILAKYSHLDRQMVFTTHAGTGCFQMHIPARMRENTLYLNYRTRMLHYSMWCRQFPLPGYYRY